MKRSLLLAFALLFAFNATGAEVGRMFKEPLSPRTASYSIRAELDASNHRLVASERILWKNTTANEAAEASFHLYLNAFMNNRSTFMVEAGDNWPWMNAGAGSWGYCRVQEIYQIAGGKKYPLAQEFPPGEDRTVMKVRLARPVPPGGAALFEVSFDCQLPRIIARSGYAGSYHLVGQWFPKLGVFEGERGWNCHPYHANSEFFSDFGSYYVEVTLPTGYVVGASGIEVGRRISGSRQTVTFLAEDVTDFAWAASPDFKVVKERWEGSGREVNLIFLMQQGNVRQVDRYISPLKGALTWLSDKVYPYPYPQITVVDPSNSGRASGGMEYEMFFTAGLSPLDLRSERWPEVTVIHELCHSYWRGMSANNEFEEAWLDEGFASYCEARISETLYGDTSIIDGLLGIRYGGARAQRMGYIGMDSLDPVVRKSWEYSSSRSYFSTSYAKAALVLETLEKRVGRPAMDRLLREFFDRAKFSHPTTADFIRVCKEVLGNWSDAFLRPLLYGTGTVDFSVAWVRQLPVREESGFFFKGGRLTSSGESVSRAKKGASKDDGVVKSEILIKREGELLFPVEVVVRFENGSKKVETWDGSGAWKRFSYVGSRVSSVEVDPSNRIPIEKRKLNNTWSEKPQKLPASGLQGRARTLCQGLMTMLFNIL